MGITVNKGVRIAGISCVVPDDPVKVSELGKPYFTDEVIARIQKSVGTDTLYFTSEDQCSGDLGIAAAEDLLGSLGWERDTIDGLIFVSQTLDYIVPPSVCRIQSELDLPKECFVLDTNYGCHGYAASLMFAYQLIVAGMCKRILLVTAECHHKYISREDEATALLFGDAGAATAIEACEQANDSESFFKMISDGKYAESLALGNYKKVQNPQALDPDHVYMDGETLTKYMFREIPSFCKEFMDETGTDINSIDSFLFHQANAYMIRYLSRRMKIDLSKVPINIGNYGNTSAVSIPLLICDKKKELFSHNAGTECKGIEKTLILSFGGGYIISGTVMNLGNLKGGQIRHI